MIGRSSDFVPLSDIVANKMTWIALPPAMKAALRNLQVTPNILNRGKRTSPFTLRCKPNHGKSSRNSAQVSAARQPLAELECARVRAVFGHQAAGWAH